MINYLNTQTQEKYTNKRRIPLNIITINKLEAIYGVMKELLRFYNKITEHGVEKIFLTQCEIILHALSRAEYNISAQLYDDIDRELSRLHWITELCKIHTKAEYVSNKNTSLVQTAYKLCTDAIMCFQIFSHDQALVAKNRLEKLLKTIEVVGEVSSEDKRMIVKAMGLKSGHWYACPQGHVYCITECGGAMQIAKCPECGASIGGTSHRLLSDNRVATEMDGATAPAWPQ